MNVTDQTHDTGMSDTNRPVIAIIGGTGALGSALASRWASAGYPVIIGSRSKDKAVAFAATFEARERQTVRGDDNSAAARHADIIVIAVPWSNHQATLDEIAPHVADKIVVDTVVPLQPPKVSLVHVPEQGSAAKQAQMSLGPGVRVVSAFHNVSAGKLAGGGAIDCDVLVFGDDKPAREAVGELVVASGARPVDGGSIANSIAAEALTAVLIGINRRYKSGGAGIRITGLPDVAREGGGNLSGRD
jgi:8-hydroxy-5-deazaflavin:NADPH oxidoreductase